jgi:hypothetical protein
MIRLPTLFWLIVVSTAGFAMFAVKYQVQELADQLARTVKQADDTERSMRVLDAEWAYLNRPDALAQMNQSFLSLSPIATKQLRTNVADIPMRPAPPPPPPAPPPPAPVETVAANPPIAVAAAAPVEDPAPQPVLPPTPPPEAPATESARPVVTASLDTPLATRPAKPAAVSRTAVRPAAPHRAASLNELIAQIAESR